MAVIPLQEHSFNGSHLEHLSHHCLSFDFLCGCLIGLYLNLPGYSLTITVSSLSLVSSSFSFFHCFFPFFKTDVNLIQKLTNLSKNADHIFPNARKEPHSQFFQITLFNRYSKHHTHSDAKRKKEMNVGESLIFPKKCTL